MSPPAMGETTTTLSPSTFFNDCIKVTPIGTHTYTAFLRPEWCIGTVPHGGYTTAVLHRLATTHFTHTHSARYSSHSSDSSPPDPISMQLTFLRRTAVGKAVLHVQDTKLGARTSTIHVTLSQPVDKPKGTATSKVKDDEKVEEEEQLEVKVVGYITVSPASAETGLSAPTSWTLLPPSPSGSGPNGRVDLTQLRQTGRDGVWGRVHAPFPEFRRASTQVDLFGPILSDEDKKELRPGQVDQWARFCPGQGNEKGKESVAWTNEAVAYLVDMFPMALDGFDVATAAAEQKANTSNPDANPAGDGAGAAKPAKYWYPTVTLNIDFKQRLLPSQGVEWLYSRVQTRVVRDGRTDLDVVVLDSKGEVVALSTQVGLVVSSSRNIGTRKLEMAREKL